MKKIFLMVILFPITFEAFSTIINVDNNPNRPNSYVGDLQLAVNSASSGDTLYVYPSNTSYGTISINKRLYLFGKGFDGTQGYVSRINYLNLDTATSPATNPSGSSFQGLTINSLSCQKPNITNIIVAGNYFNGGITLGYNCSGWLIINNYVENNINLNSNSSIIISNNIFQSGYSYPISNSNSSSVIFSHNLVVNFYYLYQVSNAIVTDNIFICSGSTNPSYMYNNIFYNNISWRTTLNPYAMPPEANIGSGNKSNQDPQFMTALSSGDFDITKDYHLKTSSPGKNAATDGTDIGPYGGSNPFVWGGSFTIPKITEANITNPVINVSTPINVNVKATKAGL